MSGSRSAVMLALFGIAAAFPVNSLMAAADQTNGMALLSASVANCSSASATVGSGVVSVSNPFPGSCDITFDRDLTECTCTASFGVKGGGFSTTQQNMISVICPGSDAKTLRVGTIINGAATNAPFHLIVFCPK